MARKTTEEKIAELKAKQEKAAAKKKAIDARLNAELKKAEELKRKARAHRLIEVGAMLETAFGRELNADDRRLILETLTEQHQNRQGQTYSWIQSIDNQVSKKKQEEAARKPMADFSSLF